jgi:hypothetical protein
MLNKSHLKTVSRVNPCRESQSFMAVSAKVWGSGVIERKAARSGGKVAEIEILKIISSAAIVLP